MTMQWKKIKASIRWLKSHPVVTVLSIIAVILGVIKGIPAAWEAGSEVLDIPFCFTYANRYSYSGGVFEKSENSWIETGANIFKFKELYRNRDYILLKDTTGRLGRQSDMVLRLPVCGGIAQWSYENPHRWIDLYVVWR